MVAKYGHALTDSEWIGLPLRVGTFAGTGRVEALSSDSDAVLVWSGGVSEVSIRYSVAEHPEMGTLRHRFVRHSGMVDLLPRGTVLHEIKWRGEETNCISVNVPPCAASQLLGEGNTGLGIEGGPRFNLVDAHVVDLVQRLSVQATLAKPLGASYVQSLSLALVSYVSGTFGRREAPPATGHGLPELQTEKLIAFVEDNIALNLGLIDLATVAGYSPDHFARLFKRSFGVSPHQYIMARRVERAKAMLRDRTQSLVRIAAASGFSSQAHLNAVFKQHTGLTPGAYRKG